MRTVEDFIYTHEGHRRRVLQYLHQWFTEQLGLTDKIRYNIPFYYGHSWICYLNPVGEDRVELAFLRGNELSNAAGLLLSKGRKQVAGVEFASVQDIPKEALDDILQEAILLDEANASRR